MKVEVTVTYKDKDYTFFDNGYNSYDHAEFMFSEGNYSCDCNLSAFINDQCDNSFEVMECGEEITLKSIIEIKEG